MSRALPIRSKPTTTISYGLPAADPSATPSLQQPIKPTLSSPLSGPHEKLQSFSSGAPVIPVSQDKSEISYYNETVSSGLIRSCCGVNCCKTRPKAVDADKERVEQPNNEAYRSLHMNIEYVPTHLSGIPDLPKKTVSILPLSKDIITLASEKSDTETNSNSASPAHTTKSSAARSVNNTKIDAAELKSSSKIDTSIHPPWFVQPHAPYELYSAPIFNARELTRPGAEKRTYHFDLDVTDYPDEMGVDFKVGGAIGITAPNKVEVVDEFLDLLGVPRHIRNIPIILKTSSGRWPTVWGDDMPRELATTRRDVVTWCSDLQSFRIDKSLLRLLAEHAIVESEKKILLYLISDQGQSDFCELRTGPYITIPQLLHAFPSSRPPLDAILSVLPQLCIRFYSLSNDPHEICDASRSSKRIIEFAVTVWEHPDWDGTTRTGVGSGFLERQAKKFIEAQKRGEKLDLRVPLMKGLMANSFARDFASDGPMLLVGAGVGISPFRGFVQRRLRNANCANKVWVIQGIRDSLLDELYNGEWGVHESEVKKVVESRQRSGHGRYVQDEVRAQADLVWSIINSLDGRIFVCGSSHGMSQGVRKALTDVAISKGHMNTGEAEKFWEKKKESGQYIVEAW